MAKGFSFPFQIRKDKNVHVGVSRNLRALADFLNSYVVRLNDGGGSVDLPATDMLGRLLLSGFDLVHVGEIFFDAAKTMGIFIGDGSPETVVAASPPSVYLNKSGGAGTTIWIKESGTGNTGWVGK